MAQLSFCDSPFWDSSILNQNHPDFTDCFEYTAFAWIPGIFLFTLGPFWVLSSINLAIYDSRFTRLYVTKLASLSALVAMEILAFILSYVYVNDVIYMSYLTKSILDIIQFIYIFGVLYLVNQFDRKYSMFLMAYWLITFVCNTFILRTRVTKFQDGREDDLELITFIFRYVLVFVNLVLSLISSEPESQGHNRSYPEERTNLISKLSFFWITGLLVKGFKREINKKDVWDIGEKDKCGELAERFEIQWEEHLSLTKEKKRQQKEIESQANGTETYELKTVNGHAKGNKESGKEEDKESHGGDEQIPSLAAFMYKFYRQDIWISVFLKSIETFMGITGPILLDGLIKFIEKKEQSTIVGYFFALLLFFALLVQYVCLEHSNNIAFYVGVRIRTVLMDLIYKKSLRLSSESRAKTQSGEIINLMQVNANTIADFAKYANYTWAAPLEILLSVIVLYFYIGNAIFAGIAAMAVMAPLNSWLAHKISIYQADKLVISDSRIKIINEVLNGIKVIKFYGWEVSFEKMINKLKNSELGILTRYGFSLAFFNFSFGFTTYVMVVLSFVTYIYTDPVNNILDPSITYVCLTLFNKIRNPLFMLGPCLSSLVQVKVAFDRISHFLSLEEAKNSKEENPNDLENCVVFQKASFSWTSNPHDALFENLDFKVPKGKLIAVVGKVGSGKSSFIHALLGEMHKVGGSYYINGSLSYAAQQAWIQNATLRDNILFGKPFDEKTYREVIDACALVTDLNILAAGDRTEIGEKGINLSGGQKQRISLARAVYNDSDVYLFDDPLSAVDAHVGKHIFDNVVGPDGILRGKTRIFVTNALSFLSECDEIIMLDNGTIAEMGSYDSLVEKDGQFAKFIKNYVQSSNQEEEYEEKKEEEKKDDKNEKGEQETDLKDSGEDGDEVKAGQNIIGAENIETGHVKFKTMVQYIEANSYTYMGIFVTFYILMYVCQGFAGIWLSEWSDLYLTEPPERVDKDFYITIYAVVGLGQHTCSIIAELITMASLVRSSRTLENNMLKSIMRSTMQFFESTPIGRILNRFSKDMYSVEFILPIAFKDFAYCIFDVITTLVIITISTPLFSVIIIPLFLVYFILQRIYVVTCSKLKRLDSVSKSPVFSYLAETLSGITTIKAYQAEDRFRATIQKRIDDNNEFYYPINVLDRWLEIYLGIVGNIIIISATIFAIVSRDTTSPGLAGLSLTFALSSSAMLNYMVKMTALLESNLTSVERVREYWKTPSEADWVVPNKRPAKDWPQKGEIRFLDYSVRYRPELEPALKSINVDIKPGEKIGIVGRTGAGKSSLSLCLFRILEVREGDIEIDGIRIKDIGLHDLRQKLTIIPQDPVIFSGSLRMNLDPFEQYDDRELWSALEKAHLKEFVQELDNGLMFECSEGGENLSVGQRQLLCLARALLRNTQILLLDEATAAIDHSTDELIQTTIREAFARCTILTIAHRLNTILDSDRIMVLDKGKIIEFDSPEKLMSNPDGHFYSMAVSAGIINPQNTA